MNVDNNLTKNSSLLDWGKVLSNQPTKTTMCGNVLINDEVLVYYGGADNVMCVATYEINELMPKK